MDLLNKIANSIPDAEVEKVCIGANWSAVVLWAGSERLCGLASNPEKGEETNHARLEAIGNYRYRTAADLIDLVLNQHGLLAGVGMAAINALLPKTPNLWIDGNAGDLLAEKGAGKRVALVGHFPFVPDLQTKVGRLDILELRPRQGDYHASQAPEIIPQADVVAITSMAFVNGTMENLLDLCPPEAYVMVLGPSTPLSPIMFSAGVNLLAGSIVEHIDQVCQSVLDGDSFRQVKKNGIRLVAMER